MPDIATLTTFLGWCTVINVGLLCFATFMLVFTRGAVKSLHNSLTGISAETLDMAYFNFLGNYKLAIFIFNLVPYFALRIMA